MDSHPAEPLYVDKGLDFYASRISSFDGTLDSKISMGWVATWDYAGSSIEVWKGFWSIPATWN